MMSTQTTYPDSRLNALQAMRCSVQFIDSVLGSLENLRLMADSEHAPSAMYALYGKQVRKKLIEAGLALKSEPISTALTSQVGSTVDAQKERP